MPRVLMAVAVLATGIFVAAPAEAKVPSRTPEITVKCANGKKGKVWWQGTKQVETVGDGDQVVHWDLNQLAVDNQCKQWLYFDVRTNAESESNCCHGVQVAPGANFTKTGTATGIFSGYEEGPSRRAPFSVTERAKDCVNPDGDENQIRWDVAKDGKVTTTKNCERQYPEDQSRSIFCPESWNAARHEFDRQVTGTWKVDDRKILKLAVDNPCTFQVLFWWKTVDGKRISLWVDETSSFDLWKEELVPLPLKTKDGIVSFIDGPRMSPTTMDLHNYDENWRVFNGTPYLWSKG